MRQVSDFSFIVGSHLNQIFFSFCIFEGETFQHPILHRNNLVKSFCLIFEGQHNFSHFLSFPESLTRSQVLSFFKFCPHQPFHGFFFPNLVIRQILNLFLIAPFSVLRSSAVILSLFFPLTLLDSPLFL